MKLADSAFEFADGARAGGSHGFRALEQASLLHAAAALRETGERLAGAGDVLLLLEQLANEI
jgi:recombinational DNA repair protein (RecF pathway)